MEKETQDVILQLKHITKLFPGVRALSDVNFTLRRQSVHTIVGENGAGKSTLMKILSGMYRPTEGEIWINGEKVEIHSEQDAFSHGISMIYQELNSVLDMTVYENIYLGRMPKRGCFVDHKKMIQETEEILQSLELPIHAKTLMRELPVALRQMVEIAKAISRNAKIIVMDEPTSSISQKETQTLFKFIRKLQARGVSIIYISHRLEELPQIADEVTILRDGQYIHSCKINEISKAEMIRYMVGRDLTNQFPKEEVPIGDVVMSVEDLTGAGFEHISFQVRSGEILGVSGLVGAGRTEVMRSIFGLDRFQDGIVKIDGKSLQIHSPGDAIKAGIAMVPEDRRKYGLVLCRSVKENTSLVHLRTFLNVFHLIDHQREKSVVQEQMTRFKTKTSSMNAEVGNMSGGNQQKVVLSKWMIQVPKVLILDEPTRGIDVGAKYEIYKIMGELAKQGIAIIMISSELPEILGMSDRIIVMSEGQLTGEISREEATQERIMKLSAGGSIDE